MDATTNLKSAFEDQVLPTGKLAEFQNENWKTFSGLGLPALKHEEWRYARIRTVFKDDMLMSDESIDSTLLQKHILPGTETFSRVVFVNGRFQPALSKNTEAPGVVEIKPLEVAAGDEDDEFVYRNLGHSQRYHSDGINALNAAFAAGGAFIKVNAGKQLEKPVVIYHISDSSQGFRFSQPRILIHAASGSSLEVIENYLHIGNGESLTNQVTEICISKDAVLHYVKLQKEGAQANHTGTTHIRQLEKSMTHSVTITLSGKLVRNNLNMVMEAEHGESHMYGLYLVNGETLVDNHTIVDNAMPHCLSNELYKGIMDEKSTGVFNGKIFVRKDAQKTNAYQSNKNILLGDHASANTKPQLEIFADDVKCSHGCTIGKLDDDALFYLRTRGISEKNAQALLLHAFAIDILDQIKNESIRNYIDKLISERLSFDY